ncbi:MAG TPA: hypothetical protein VFF30_10935 [Nitrososphaerales archaeon]|nr:hypothetical protein [Nitrososphaerales archaeon]
MSREKASIVTTRKRTMYFCENCFRAVFKYDESLKTLPMIYEEGGRKTPFVVRSTNWHRSSYMVVKEVTETAAGSNKGGKQVFIGDMYLRGVLKEQNRPLGKANFFNWVSWSEELAQKYKEDVPSASNPPVPQEVSATTSDLAPGSES